MLRLKPYLKTIRMEATAPMDGGLFYFLGGYVIRFIRLFLLLGIWRSVFTYSGELSTEQAKTVLQYTLLASAFYQQLDVVTTASITFWEGTVSSRYLRPVSIFGQYIAETIGRWMPGLLLFTIPVLFTAPLFGVTLETRNLAAILFAVVSLLLGMMIGFAMDFIFTGIMVILGNMHYHAYRLRAAVTVLLSGALIPLYLFPWGLGKILGWLPFASMASAPLQIYTGTGNVTEIILLQGVWCAILWFTAVVVWQKNRQRLVIFGG